ncbi:MULTISPECIES: hypothetical protein [Solibacillus]|uniref:Uncharacterized protein n=1 Tax=Solibacillus faecavium TaxID=2762221 RepID=A0ABR8XXK8_9BACL|nr:hypothetical protein [Solibacillus faecavium]MBD8036674.1 hypothetical protein [Solibacillus faecavium]
MEFLAKKILGNTIIFWILFLTLGLTGFYLVFMKSDLKGFYLLFLMVGLSILFEKVLFKKDK